MSSIHAQSTAPFTPKQSVHSPTQRQKNTAPHRSGRHGLLNSLRTPVEGALVEGETGHLEKVNDEKDQLEEEEKRVRAQV